MNRGLSNAIRYLMDEWLPPAIRDSRWFMRPAYMLAYRRLDVREVMDFKLLYFAWSPERRAEFYRDLRSISRSRATDLNSACIRRIIDLMPEKGARIADFGCGSGYLLELLAERFPDNDYVGFDFKVPTPAPGSPVKYECADLETIELAERSFDIVLCSHVLEHLIDYRRVMRILARGAAQRFVFVVPRQRPFRFTLDEHLNFFPLSQPLMHELGIPGASIECLDGDWLIDGSCWS